MLLLGACFALVCRGDDWSSFREENFAQGGGDDDEEENLDEEVEFPGGVQPDGKPKSAADVRRDPFVVKVFDHGHMTWKDPESAEEHAKEVHRQCLSAWERTVSLDLEESARPGRHDTKRIAAGNIIE